MTGMSNLHLPPPSAHDVDWPTLVAVAERYGIPVLRVDEHGDSHLIRSVAQLEAEWAA